MSNPGPDAEDRRAVARQSWMESPTMNILAVAVATTEAKASVLPGRVNGPADAQRHIVWVDEMTGRFGPNTAGSLAELHEFHGQVSAARRELVGGGGDPINDAAATAMDRRNNLIGVSIGERARTFDDVIRMAREVIDRSPEDGSGGMIGAVWQARDRWLANPSRDASRWNRPRPNRTRVPRQHVDAYLLGGESYRRGADHRALAAERCASLAAERRAAWTRMLDDDEAAGGPVDVRVHLRDGHPVRAHTRSRP
jgi:hypothetical protein